MCLNLKWGNDIPSNLIDNRLFSSENVSIDIDDIVS